MWNPINRSFASRDASLSFSNLAQSLKMPFLTGSPSTQMQTLCGAGRREGSTNNSLRRVPRISLGSLFPDGLRWNPTAQTQICQAKSFHPNPLEPFQLPGRSKNGPVALLAGLEVGFDWTRLSTGMCKARTNVAEVLFYGTQNLILMRSCFFDPHWQFGKKQRD